MQRGNGAVIGKQNTPTASVATGVWALNEVQRAVLNGTWPAAAVSDPYFENVTMLLHGNGTNGAQNNTFLDSSTNNFAITRNGNTTQGTFAPFGNNWSNYFDGSGDYLEIANSTNLDFGSGDFTVECFVYFNSVAAQQTFFSKWRVGPGYEYVFGYDPANGLTFIYSTTGTGAGNVGRNYAVTLSVGVWYHIAFCRASGSTRAFVNGSQVGSTTSDNVTIVTTNQIQTIGITRDDSLFWPMNGYISNLRVVKGTALYTTNFNTSTIPLTAVTNTQLLTCQSNRFIDNSSNNFTITRNGDVSVQRFSPFSPTAPYAAGTDGGSGYFDGSGDYLSGIGTTSSFNFMHNSSALFTFDGWVYLSSTASEQYLFANNNGASGQIGCALSVVAGGALSLFITRGVSGVSNVTAYVVSSGTVPTNQWVHIAVTYDQSQSSNNAKFYINGASAGTGNKTGNSPSGSDATNALTVAAATSAGVSPVNGYISNLRISNSIVYSSAFTPPTAPVTGGSLLLNFTNAGIIDNAEMNNLETVGNAQISTAQSKFGGGSMYFDGTGDYLIGPANQNAALGTGDFTVEAWVYVTTFSTTTGFQAIFSNRNSTSTQASFDFGIRNSDKYLYFYNRNTDSSTFSTAGLSGVNTWIHVAIARVGSTITFYINGTASGTASVSTNSFGTSNVIYVGTNFNTTPDIYNGYIDDLRITKGYARYTANFTPPTAPFPDF